MALLQKIQETEKRNTEAYIKSGTIFEDRAEAFEKLRKDQEKLWTGVLRSENLLLRLATAHSARSLAEVLDLTPPTLPSGPVSSSTSAGVVSTGPSQVASSDNQYGPGSKWSDEEERRFYEDLVDLRTEVPGVFLGVGDAAKGGEKEEPAPGEAEKDLEKAMGEMEEKLQSTSLSTTCVQRCGEPSRSDAWFCEPGPALRALTSPWRRRRRTKLCPLRRRPS